LLNGLSISQTGGLGNIPTTWSVAGTADFNADGKGDLLWLDKRGHNVRRYPPGPHWVSEFVTRHFCNKIGTNETRDNGMDD
jgi:hypothetical protein